MSNMCKLLECPLYNSHTNTCEDNQLFLNKESGQTECRYCTQSKAIYEYEVRKKQILDQLKNIHKDTIKYYVIEVSDRFNVTSVNLENYLIAQGTVKADMFEKLLHGMDYVGKLILNEADFLTIVMQNENNKDKLKRCR